MTEDGHVLDAFVVLLAIAWKRIHLWLPKVGIGIHWDTLLGN